MIIVFGVQIDSALTKKSSQFVSSIRPKIPPTPISLCFRKPVIYFNEFMILTKTTVSIKAGWFKAALEKAANLSKGT